MTGSATDASFGPVLVIGTGLIGGSIGLALRRAGVQVLLEDTDADSLQTAVSMGAGQQLTQESPGIVVVAVPPRVAGVVMSDAAHRFPAATITDVTSVKEPVIEAADAAGADMTRLVGGHPMAGRETAGPGSARADLFDDRMWIITATSESSPAHVDRARELARRCGAYPVDMTAPDHDAAVALISHVPQVLSSALAGQLEAAPEGHVVIAGQGLRDMTRIAGSDTSLWSDILSANSVNVRSALSDLIEALQVLHDDLAEDESPDAVREFLVRGGAGRARIPGKHGAADREFTQVMVMIADKPGELARLFGAVGDVDVNLEDVRIEHVLGKPSGLVGLFVTPDAVPVLVQGLKEREFDVR